MCAGLFDGRQQCGPEHEQGDRPAGPDDAQPAVPDQQRDDQQGAVSGVP